MKVAAFWLTLLMAVAQAHAHGDDHPAADRPGMDGAHAGGEAGHAAALGEPGDPQRVTRTIEIRMNDDMRYRPALIRVKQGETIRFLVKNEGRMKHELVLGTAAELRAHAAMMRKFPEMEHDDPNAVEVEPGQTGELIWHFSKVGRFDFACLMPGHFEAGMRGRLIVTRK